MNRKLIVTLTAALMIAVTGCGNSEVKTNSSAEVEVSTEASTEASTESTQETGTVTVVHDLGETEVPKNPQKVVVLDFGALDAMDALGLNVVGVNSSSSLPDYLSKYADEAVYANVGSLKEADMEAIYALEPDMIISGARLADYYDELSEIAPTITLSVDNTDYMSSFKTAMNYLGEIYDKQDEVNSKVEELEAQVALINEKAAAKNVNALIALSNGDTFSVYGKGSRFGIIHDEFGIAPVDETIEVSTHGQNASFEYIVEQNPDYLFIVDRTAVTSSGEGSAASMFDNELIRGTEAYKNGRIVYLNPTIWYTVSGGFTSTQMMVDEISSALDI